jgi:predicted membrane channel-forming protein YqfA (hemolysin III family)
MLNWHFAIYNKLGVSMSYFRKFPLFSIFSLVAASFVGCVFASLAAYLNYLQWVKEGTQGMTDPIRMAIDFGTGFMPLVTVISLLVGTPSLLLTKKITIIHLLSFTVLGSLIGLLGLINGMLYWGSTLFCFGFFTALSACAMLLMWQAKSRKEPPNTSLHTEPQAAR